MGNQQRVVHWRYDVRETANRLLRGHEMLTEGEQHVAWFIAAIICQVVVMLVTRYDLVKKIEALEEQLIEALEGKLPPTP